MKNRRTITKWINDFLRQIEDNEKEVASVDISFSPSNDNLNSTLKSLPKENNQKKEINFKNGIFK